MNVQTCETITTVKITSILDFRGGPVAKTPHSQCSGPRFDPWSGKQIPHVATKDPACHN